MPKGTPTPPRSRKNPIGGTRLERRTEQRLRKGLRSVQRWLMERFEEIPRERIEVNSFHLNATRYEYQIDATQLRLIVDELRRRLGEDVPVTIMEDAVRRAYESGTGQAVAQLAALTDEYTREITQVLSSAPWQRRVALIQARQFELMQGFTGDTAADLGRVLSDAVQDGLNPREVAKTLRDRFGVSKTRAERIARTEITGALRRATWDETEDARQRLGIRTGLLWFSALSPTTRESHARLHGRTVDQEFVREFYSTDANGINCKCSQQPILVDDDGNPVGQDLIDRLRRQRSEFEPGEGLSG